MIHQNLIQLLKQIKLNNDLLYILFIILISYLVLGFSTSLLFLVAINLKEICILGTVSKFRTKFIEAVLLLILWPFALDLIYELWYNFCMYLSCLFAGETFRRNVMSDKNLIQIRHIVCDNKGEVAFKKLATNTMACIEELIIDGEDKGKTFVTIFGLEEKPKSQIVPNEVSFASITTLEFLKELKENGLVGLRRVEAEKEIKFDFENTKIESFNLVFPEEVFCYTFEDISTVYVTKAIAEDNEDNISDLNLMQFKDQLYNEVKINSNNMLFMVDYTNHEAYALDSNRNEIMNCEFEGYDCESKFTRVRIGETILKYVYNNGYLDHIDIEKTNNENNFGYYLKVDELDKKRNNQHITVTYAVPYLRDIGNVYIYSENCRIYRTDNIYIDKGKVVELETDYRILSDEEEIDLNDAFSKTLENSSYII